MKIDKTLKLVACVSFLFNFLALSGATVDVTDPIWKIKNSQMRSVKFKAGYFDDDLQEKTRAIAVAINNTEHEETTLDLRESNIVLESTFEFLKIMTSEIEGNTPTNKIRLIMIPLNLKANYFTVPDDATVYTLNTYFGYILGMGGQNRYGEDIIQ